MIFVILNNPVNLMTLNKARLTETITYKFIR